MKYTIVVLLFFIFGCSNPQKPIESEKKFCPEVYAPVCGKVMVECIKAPCPTIKQTFSNRCFLRLNPRATFLYDGECQKDK